MANDSLAAAVEGAEAAPVAPAGRPKLAKNAKLDAVVVAAELLIRDLAKPEGEAAPVTDEELAAALAALGDPLQRRKPACDAYNAHRAAMETRAQDDAKQLGLLEDAFHKASDACQHESELVRILGNEKAAREKAAARAAEKAARAAKATK